LKRAQENKLISIKAHDLRKFTTDKHKKVDDRPFGGGAGMVMMVQPIATAVAKLQAGRGVKKKSRVILFSTRGKKFTNVDARRLAKYDQLIFICGRYEGVDERVAEYIADEEISIGDYVLTGGELPAMVVIDSVSRQIPGVLGKAASLEEAQGSYPRPEEYVFKLKGKSKKVKVPDVLKSGNHAKIDQWRKSHG
jgi:tRNA (guanine37-N1)-methyltransferase